MRGTDGITTSVFRGVFPWPWPRRVGRNGQQLLPSACPLKALPGQRFDYRRVIVLHQVGARISGRRDSCSECFPWARGFRTACHAIRPDRSIIRALERMGGVPASSSKLTVTRVPDGNARAPGPGHARLRSASSLQDGHCLIPARLCSAAEPP